MWKYHFLLKSRKGNLCSENERRICRERWRNGCPRIPRIRVKSVCGDLPDTRHEGSRLHLRSVIQTPATWSFSGFLEWISACGVSRTVISWIWKRVHPQIDKENLIYEKTIKIHYLWLKGREMKYRFKVPFIRENFGTIEPSENQSHIVSPYYIS